MKGDVLKLHFSIHFLKLNIALTAQELLGFLKEFPKNQKGSKKNFHFVSIALYYFYYISNRKSYWEKIAKKSLRDSNCFLKPTTY